MTLPPPRARVEYRPAGPTRLRLALAFAPDLEAIELNGVPATPPLAAVAAADATASEAERAASQAASQASCRGA